MVMSNNSDTTMDLELHKNNSNASNILVPYQAATGNQYNQVSGTCIVQCSAGDDLRFKLNRIFDIHRLHDFLCVNMPYLLFLTKNY